MSDNSKIVKYEGEKVESFDLARLLGELIDHRWLIISVTAMFSVVGIIFCLFSTPIYQADALVQIEQKQGNTLINSINQILPDSQPQSAPEISLIRSRMILGKTVDDLNLQTVISEHHFPIFGKGWSRLTGEDNGNIKVTLLFVSGRSKAERSLKLTVIDSNKFKIENEKINISGRVGELINEKGMSLIVSSIDAKPGSVFDIAYISRLEAIDSLQKVLSVVDTGKDTGILSLSLTGDDPEKIELILNNITDNYLAQNISRQAAQDSKSLEFLQEQLPKVRTELDVSESKLNQYRQLKDSVDLNLEAKAILDQIVNVDNQLNELTIREAEVSQLFTYSHPTYKALLEKRKTLEQEKEKLNKRVSAMPETQQEILTLSRDVESGRAVYMQLLNRQQELSIAKSSAIGNVRIIDQAISQPKPIKPNKAIIVLACIFFGGVVSILLVIILAYLRRGIDSPEQLEEHGVTVYASVPMSEWIVNQLNIKNKLKKSRASKDKSLGLLARENPADLAIEAIRGIRTTLHFAMMESKNNILMISGASPSAGKTFISSNLSAIMSQIGRKVLYIDGDMRKGYVHDTFNLENTTGLSDILSGRKTVEQAIQTEESFGFDFISRGQVPPNPTELLMHSRFGELMNWAHEKYDLVIIDTPPILAVTDPAIIGAYAGTTLLIARFEVNTVKEILVSIKRFEQSGISIKGCVLNGVVKKARSYYGYGYSSYGYSYENKTKK